MENTKKKAEIISGKDSFADLSLSINQRFHKWIKMPMSATDDSKSDNYSTVRLPKELMQEIDEIIKAKIRGYKSRSEFIKEAIRKRLDEVQHWSISEV
jgi:predicted DNA-binding protein